MPSLVRDPVSTVREEWAKHPYFVGATATLGGFGLKGEISPAKLPELVFGATVTVFPDALGDGSRSFSVDAGIRVPQLGGKWGPVLLAPGATFSYRSTRFDAPFPKSVGQADSVAGEVNLTFRLSHLQATTGVGMGVANYSLNQRGFDTPKAFVTQTLGFSF